MNKLLIISFLAFLLFLPVVVVAQEDAEIDYTGGAYPTETPGSDSNDINAKRGSSADHKLKGPEFSNQLTIASQRQNEIRPHYYVLEGYVDIVYHGMRLQSDHAEYDTVTKDLVATGNVVLDQEDQHITGDRLELNLDTKKGVMYHARGFVPPQIFFYGTKLEKLGEDTYRIHNGIFTECSQIVPHWRLNTTKARMTVNEYIHFHNFLLKAKTIPIFYSPYMMWPIRRERATGFLFPGFGPNSRKGFWLGGSFFWAMNRSMDSTYWLDHYQLRGWGGGAEYRYAESETSNGGLKVYVANDTLLGRQYTAQGSVKQDLPADFRLAGIADYFSSFAYIRDYANTLQQALTQTKAAQLYLTRNWSYYSLNFLNNWSERETGRNGFSSFYHVPEVELQVRSLKLGPTPLFAALQTSFDELGRKNDFGDGTSNAFYYQRYDVFPSLSFPMTYLSWLTFTPTFGERYTRWTKSLGLDGVADDPITRRYHDVTLDLRGPNFSKIFDTPGLGYSQKWKHAIEPQITFRYVQDIPEISNLLQLDDVDFIAGQKTVTYSLTNLVYAKRPVKEEKEYKPDEYQYYNPKPLEEPPETPWEFISWRVSQTYRLDSDSFNSIVAPGIPRISPLNSTLRINPSVNYNIEFSADYDLKFRQLTQIQLGSTLRNTDRWYGNLSYVYSNPTPQPSIPGFPRIVLRAQDSFQVNAGIGLWKNQLVLNGDAGYDISNRLLLKSSLGMTYNADCFSVGVEWRHFSNAIRIGGKENQITFSISLPNIGNLVNFQSGAPPKRF